MNSSTEPDASISEICELCPEHPLSPASGHSTSICPDAPCMTAMTNSSELDESLRDERKVCLSQSGEEQRLLSSDQTMMLSDTYDPQGCCEPGTGHEQGSFMSDMDDPQHQRQPDAPHDQLTGERPVSHPQMLQMSSGSSVPQLQGLLLQVKYRGFVCNTQRCSARLQMRSVVTAAAAGADPGQEEEGSESSEAQAEQVNCVPAEFFDTQLIARTLSFILNTSNMLLLVTQQRSCVLARPCPAGSLQSGLTHIPWAAPLLPSDGRSPQPVQLCWFRTSRPSQGQQIVPRSSSSGISSFVRQLRASPGSPGVPHAGFATDALQYSASWCLPRELRIAHASQLSRLRRRMVKCVSFSPLAARSVQGSVAPSPRPTSAAAALSSLAGTLEGFEELTEDSPLLLSLATSKQMDKMTQLIVDKLGLGPQAEAILEDQLASKVVIPRHEVAPASPACTLAELLHKPVLLGRTDSDFGTPLSKLRGTPCNILFSSERPTHKLSGLDSPGVQPHLCGPRPQRSCLRLNAMRGAVQFGLGRTSARGRCIRQGSTPVFARHSAGVCSARFSRAPALAQSGSRHRCARLSLPQLPKGRVSARCLAPLSRLQCAGASLTAVRGKVSRTGLSSSRLNCSRLGAFGPLRQGLAVRRGLAAQAPRMYVSSAACMRSGAFSSARKGTLCAMAALSSVFRRRRPLSVQAARGSSTLRVGASTALCPVTSAARCMPGGALRGPSRVLSAGSAGSLLKAIPSHKHLQAAALQSRASRAVVCKESVLMSKQMIECLTLNRTQAGLLGSPSVAMPVRLLERYHSRVEELSRQFAHLDAKRGVAACERKASGHETKYCSITLRSLERCFDDLKRRFSAEDSSSSLASVGFGGNTGGIDCSSTMLDDVCKDIEVDPLLVAADHAWDISRHISSMICSA
mmetsp:Transcript_67264/g.196647  ORF Transcript_67264/g.196647 Transcript_67264/m.196647 type:complete len:915 (+) Transcript_67264:115-2859(+)